jgi:predicted DNA-binding protein
MYNANVYSIKRMEGFSMERTQIYLTREQKKALKTIAAQKQTPLAEVVREAVEQYIAEQKPSAAERMEKASGLWKDRQELDSAAYERELRQELNKRLEGFEQ